jgi:hypothetical protein
MKPFLLMLALGLPAHAYADNVIFCKEGIINFAFSEIPESELGDVLFSSWLEGEDKKFLTGEFIHRSDSGDVVAEFPTRQKQQGHILKLSYTASTGEAFVINLENGRSTGEAFTGKCKAVPRPTSNSQQPQP